jgi:outer membrane lipoprotein LolB
VSLNLNWQHDPQESELRLINFLGSTVLNLTMTENGAKVVTDDQVFEDSNPNLLFSRLTGMAFPVSQMKHWIKGQPYQADTQSFNEQNTLQSLTKQSGNRLWTLNYDRYQDVDGLPLPYQMTLSSQDIKIKIVVSKWKIHP